MNDHRGVAPGFVGLFFHLVVMSVVLFWFLLCVNKYSLSSDPLSCVVLRVVVVVMMLCEVTTGNLSSVVKHLQDNLVNLPKSKHMKDEKL